MLKAIHNFLFSSVQDAKEQKRDFISDVLIEMSEKCKDCKIIRWKDGTVYVGECNGQKMNGNGKMIYANGEFYEGQFKDNNFHGKGKYFGLDGIYEGEWQNGLKNGYGKQKGNDGSNFVGKYQKGFKEGFGFFEWADGSFYQGMFKQDQMQGAGKIVYFDGSMMEGEWFENQIHGLAKQTDAEGNIFIGQLKNGIKAGPGLLLQRNRKIQGFWDNGNLTGMALIEQNDGNCLSIKVQNGTFTLVSDCEYQKGKEVNTSN